MKFVIGSSPRRLAGAGVASRRAAEGRALLRRRCRRRGRRSSSSRPGTCGTGPSSGRPRGSRCRPGCTAPRCRRAATSRARRRRPSLGLRRVVGREGRPAEQAAAEVRGVDVQVVGRALVECGLHVSLRGRAGPAANQVLLTVTSVPARVMFAPNGPNAACRTDIWLLIIPCVKAPSPPVPRISWK